MPRHNVYAVVSTLLALLLGYSWAHRPLVIGQEDRPAKLDIALVDMVKLFNADKEYVAKREELQRAATNRASHRERPKLQAQALLRQKHLLLACRKTYLLEWREHRL